ncbi:DUF1517 domain-containing protein [Cyanothece sp. BG0011]|uniref:DUF1517 domain-containing protein n=1 Tax=Cyanothece sp. BG0011 TaxID=2082950 RepID=UPI000D1E3C55|nr:DUF1517 domain-containing protein [Cyanothece sp. BG0011]
MLKKIKPFLKPLLILVLVITLVFGDVGSALAARTGGRIGGGSFRGPSRTYSSPRGGGYGGGGYGYGGGGFGFPFLLPFFGFGGFGSLFTVLIVIALANFLIRSVSNFGGDQMGNSYTNTKVSVAKVQVGLLASGRYLQKELDELAQTADTNTPSGRATVLQEASLALLRHPEYWVSGLTEANTTGIDAAEAKFNQLALAERSKFSSETLSNVNNQLRGSEPSQLLEGKGELSKFTETGEYIVASIIVGVEGKLDLPEINEVDNLQQALQKIASIGSDRLLAVEILWTPQAQGDTLSRDDVLVNYPNLRLV